MSSIVRSRAVGFLRRRRNLFVLLLLGTGLAITVPPKILGFQVNEPPSVNALEGRIEQPEVLGGVAKPEGRDQKASQFLVQLYTAEYSAIMARISAWTSLQYAFFPILVAACAMLTKLDSVRANFRWWAATGVLLVGYLAYQGTMLDTLQKVLFIERYLRPLTSRVVGGDQFWIHECIYRQTQVANIFFWKYWPPLICFAAVTVVAIYIRFRHGFGGWDYTFVVGALILSAGVLVLTIEGAQLEQEIIEVCEERIPSPASLLLLEERPTPASTGRHRYAAPHG